MVGKVLAAVAAAALCVGLARAEEAPRASGAPAKTVALTRMLLKLPAGSQYAVLQKGMFCTTAGATSFNGAESELKVAAYVDTFRSAFREGGLTPEPEASLFDSAGASPAEYALAGVIVDEHLTLCAPDASPTGLNKMKGQGDMTIEWQLYSRLEKQVVAKVRTTGGFTSHDVIPGGPAPYVQGSFAANVKALAADPQVRKALNGAGLSEGELLKPPAQTPMRLTNVRAVATRPIDHAAQSVVVVYSGNVLGSGFLISPDGYLLTDAHVVGDARQVRVRWADGKDGVADVLRISKERDVALLRAEAGGRPPLPLRLDPPAVGATVYAIGAPEGQRFEGTVTKGVISANRVFLGLNYLQSDVTTGHGASGGPLVDEFGRVVGLTEGGTHNATSSGIGLFTPTREAVAFLGLDLE